MNKCDQASVFSRVRHGRAQMFGVMRALSVVGLFIFMCSITLSAQAQSGRPKVGLVLKGGGALGFAHVGVLKVLERNRVPVDFIAGTSMGSIVGAAYASGATLEEMEEILSTTDWDALFGERIQRENLDFRLKSGRSRELFGDVKVGFEKGKLLSPRGAVEGQNIRPLFQRMFGNPPSPVDFDSLPIPFRAVTADIETGEKFVPAKGDLTTVVRASMSVPGAFAPVEVDNHLLVDGGIVDNLPVDVVLGMGADVLIVVDLKSDLAKRQDLTSPLSISGQMISLLLLQNSTLSMKLVRPHDVVIAPDVSAFTATQFKMGAEIMQIGETAAESMVPALQKLSLSPEQYATFLAKRTRRTPPPERIDFIRVRNNSDVSEQRVLSHIETKEGDVFDPLNIERDLQTLYQTGYFESVRYSLVREGDKSGIEIDTDGKDWLRQYVRLGFSVEDNLDGENRFRLGAAFRTMDVTSKGSYFEAQAEIGKTPRLLVELFQPFGEDNQYFFDPKLSIGRNTLVVSDGSTPVAEYNRTEGLATLAFGRRLDTLGEVALGYSRGFGELSKRIGDPSLPDKSYDIGDVYAGFELDSLDKADFPTKGLRVSTKFNSAVESLGAPSDFEELTGVVSVPMSFGRNTILLRNDFAATFGERPIERYSSLGGFLRISGILPSSIPASDYYSGGIIAFRRFSEVANPFFDLAFFAGGSYEATTIHSDNSNLRSYDLINSGSIFIGADTPLLPIYIGFGVADLGEHSFYISLGRLG